jgi:hypothetical protein
MRRSDSLNFFPIEDMESRPWGCVADIEMADLPLKSLRVERGEATQGTEVEIDSLEARLRRRYAVSAKSTRTN